MSARRSKILLAVALVLLACCGVAGGVLVREARRGRHWRIPSPWDKARVTPSLVNRGQLLAISLGDQSDVWSLEGPEPVHLQSRNWMGTDYPLPDVTFSRWSDLALLQFGGRFVAHSLRTGQAVSPTYFQTSTLRDGAVSPSGLLLAFVHRDQALQRVEVVALSSGKLVGTLQVPPGDPPPVHYDARLWFSAKEDSILAVFSGHSQDEFAYVWSLESGKLRSRFQGAARGFTSLGEVVVERSGSGRFLDAYSADEGRPVRRLLDEHARWVSASGERAIVATRWPEFPIEVYSLETSKLLRRIEPEGLTQGGELDFSAEGDRVAYAAGGWIDVWEVPR